MQIRNGKIYVANGSATVYGVGVDWSNVEVGDLFAMVLGSSALYWVNAVDTGSNPATITLNTPYLGATITEGAATNGNYAIHQDFTPNKKLPLMNAGDIETATIFSRAMQIIDSGLNAVESAGAGSSGGITVNQTAHGFVAGSAVRFDGDEYVLCFGDTITQAIADGIVSEVIDVDSFKLLTSGTFESSYNFTNGSGKTYGPGDQANVSPDSNNLVASDSAAATVFVPIVRAIGASSGATTQTGLITNIGGTNSNTFAGSGTEGLVPDPVSGYTGSRYLREDGTWQTIVIGANTVNYDSLLLGTAENADHSHADWDNNFWHAWTNGDPEDNNEKSIYWAIMNLYNRLLSRESVGTVIREKVFSGVFSTNAASVTTTTWTVPANITKVKVRAHSGTHLSYFGNGSSMKGYYSSAILTVVPAEVLTITMPNLPVLYNPPLGLRDLAQNQVARPHLTIERSGAITMILVPGAPGGRGTNNNETGYLGGQSSPLFHATDAEELSSLEHAKAPAEWGFSVFEYSGTSGRVGGQGTPAETYAPGAVKLEWLGS